MIYNYILLFLFYAIFGWTMEVIVSLIYRHKFINRGFLIGPWLPIYGFGGLLITIFLTKYMDDIFVFFVMAIVICTILEYFTSYIMEKLFHARWWDYSDKKFNINGRVCLQTCLGFGLVGCLIIYLGNPLVMRLINMIPMIVTKIMAIFGVVLFFIDVIISMKVMSNFKHINFTRKDNTEEITKKVKAALKEKNFFTKRLVEAFPDFEILRKRTKEKIDKTKAEIKKKQKEIKKMRKKLHKNEKELKKLNKRKGSK